MPLGGLGLAGDPIGPAPAGPVVAPRAAAEEAASRPSWVARLRALEERPRVVGPHARLGVVWFVVLMGSLAGGQAGLATVLAPCAGLAALQAARSRRTHPRPSAPVAGIGAALLVVAAAVGPAAMVAVAVLVVAVVAAGVVVGGPHAAEPVATVAAAGVVGLAAAAPVLLLDGGLVPVLVLLSLVAAYDASAYVVGTGASSAWEGPAAGAASVLAITLGVAAVLVPPFRGATPWLLGGLVAVLAPLGPYVASALMGDRRANVPALRRLDSLLVVAPVWCLVAARVLE